MPTLMPPTKGEQRWRAVSYLFTAMTGMYVLIAPTLSWGLQSRMGVASVVWSLFMMTAIPAAVATLMGRYQVEAVLLWLFGSALLVALVNTWARAFTDDPVLIGRAAPATALLCLFVARLLSLHRITKAPPWTATTGP